MRTTVRLNDALLDQAKREAARQGTTLTALIEEGLWLVLAQRSKPPQPRGKLPKSTAKGWVRPGVDINNTAQLMNILDGLE